MKDAAGNELNEGDILYSLNDPHYKVRIKNIRPHELVLEVNYQDPLAAGTFRINENHFLRSSWRKELPKVEKKRKSRAKQPSRQFDPETMAWV